MSSHLQFEYEPERGQDPRRAELLEATKCQIHLYEEGCELSDGQLGIIQKVINEQIHLSSDTDHHVKVTVLGDSTFSITIDGDSKFRITKHDVEEDPSVVVIQERIKERTFLTSVREFFQTIANYFYTPTYPSSELKDRKGKEAVIQDYRGFRKALQEGKSWFRSKDDIRLTSPQQAERDHMNREIDDLIRNAKKIEKALGSKDQKGEFDLLASEFSGKIMAQLKPGEAMVIPVGYLNSDNVLQPVMLRFEREADRKLIMEIYADTAEGKGDVPPLHRREFNKSVRRGEIEKVLKASFQPMITPKSRTSALKKAAKRSELFSTIHREEVGGKLDEKRSEMRSSDTEVKTKKSESDQGGRFISLTFEGFMRDIDEKMKDCWSEIDVDQEAVAQASSPSERIVGWFDHLIRGKDNKLTKNEKLNLMFFITEDYAQDQLRQVQGKRKKVSLERQLEVYKRVAGQIAHMRENIAVSLNDGHPLDTDGIPESLRETEALCHKKIEYIERKLLQKKRVGADRELSKTQSAQLGFNIGATHVPTPVTPTATLEDAAGVQHVDEVSWKEQWKGRAEAVSSVFSPEASYENRARQIATELYSLADSKATQLSVESDGIARIGLQSKGYGDLEDPDKQLAFLESLLASSLPLAEEDKQTLQSAVKEAKKDGADKGAILDAQQVKSAVAKVAGIAASQTEQIRKKIDALNNIKLEELVVDDEVKEDKLEEVIRAIVDCIDERGLKVLEDRPLGLKKDQLVILLKQMVLDPHDLPVFMTTDKNDVVKAFEQILLAIDPQVANGSKLSLIANDLRAIVNLRMLFPKPLLTEKADSRWSERRDLYKKRNLEAINHVLQSALLKRNTEHAEKTARLDSNEEFRQLLSSLNDEDAAQAEGVTDANAKKVNEIKIFAMQEVLKADPDQSEAELQQQIVLLRGKLVGADDEQAQNLSLAIKELENHYFKRELEEITRTHNDITDSLRSLEEQIAIYEKALEKDSLEKKHKFLEKKKTELKEAQRIAASGEGKEREAKVLQRVIGGIEGDYRLSHFEKSLGNLEAMVRMNALLDKQEELPEVFGILAETNETPPKPNSLSKDQSRTTLTASNETLTENVSEMTQALEQLSIAAASEVDPVKKKAMYEEIKTRSMELLSLLPPPGTEGASGTPSIWSTLTPEQSEKMRASVERLQHHVWEAQMRLSKNEMTGKEKFMMIKAQAINMALVRAEVSRQCSDLEAVLTDIYLRDPSALSDVLDDTTVFVTSSGRVIINLEEMHPGPKMILMKFGPVTAKYMEDSEKIRQVLLKDPPSERPENVDLIEETLKSILIQMGEASFDKDGFSWNADSQELTIEWGEADLDWASLKGYFENHTQLLEDHTQLNPMMLCLDPFTLDTLGINQVLTQDLTTCLAQDARLDQEVQAVYHFVLADQSRGKHRQLQSEIPLRGKEGRSALVYPMWKHTPDNGTVINPFLATLEPVAVLQSFEYNPKRDLAVNLHRKKKPARNEELQELKKIISALKSEESFTSISGAISWNHESKSLDINWDHEDLEWDQLLDIVAQSDREIQSAFELIELTSQTVKGQYYYTIAADPDFTLYQKDPQPPTGLSYFQQRPNLLLSQRKPLEVVQTQPSVIKIRAGNSTAVADVYLWGREGEADWSSFGVSSQQGVSEEQVDLLMRPKVPFLPAVDHNTTASAVGEFEAEAGMRGLEDIRQSHTYDVWKEYVMEVAGEDVLSIPPNVLLELFKIREAPDDARNGNDVTSYSASTALNALEFITDSRNQTYLNNDFVQQYIFESLFGPMVMQQALVDHPENVRGSIEQILIVLEQAQKSQNPELVGFYSTVLKNLGGHVKVAQQQIREHGLFAGHLTCLPVFRGKHCGALYRSLSQGTDELDHPRNTFFIGKESSADKSSILHPLASIWLQLEMCASDIEGILGDLENSEVSVQSILLGTGEGAPPIDEITNPQAKRQAYLHLLQEYRTNGLQDITTQDWLQILTGYELLISEDIEGGIPQLQSEVVSWVKREVLPEFQSLSPEETDKVIKQLINQKLVTEGQNTLSDSLGNKFAPVEGKMNLFEYSRSDGSTITIDLMTMSIAGVDLTKRSRSPVPIPKNIMERADVKQALHTSVVHAMMTKKGEKTTYTWAHEGQNFTMVVEGSNVDIERTIPDDHPVLAGGTYRFTSILPDQSDNHAARLLGNNGIWMKANAPFTGWILSSGMDIPTEDSLYYAQIDDSNTIQDIKSLTGGLVSTSIRFDSPSPVLFSSTENTVVLLDALSKKPKELRLPQFNVSLSKTSDNKWKLTQKGKTLGTIKATDQKEERFLKDQFGPHWDQFVIPLETDDGKTLYFMIPYTQNVDKQGRISVDQSTMHDIPHPILMTAGSDGNIKGSQASELYLAHRYLLQAEKTRNPTTAREYFQKAQQHLDNIANSPLPGTAEEIENLKYVMQLVADHPAISLTPAPTLFGLVMTIKMELFVQRAREKAKAEGVKSLQIEPEQELAELSKIAKYYDAYKVLSDPRTIRRAERSISQELFTLSREDITALDSIGRRLLISISDQIEKETYFGTTGRMAAKVTMDKPTELDPQFVLALVRMAKPAKEEISLKGINAPLPLGHLMENFWSYFMSIKNEGLTPEDLIFLFDESIIPPADSPEQEEDLRALDLQARQFLIGMASLMKLAGGKVDLMAEAENGIADAKKQVSELTEDGVFQAFISQFEGNPVIEIELGKIIDAIEELTVKELPDSDPRVPDLRALSKDLAELKTHVENFKEALQKTLTDATKLIDSTTDQYKDLTAALIVAKKDLKSALSEQQLAIQEIEEEYSETAVQRRIADVEQRAEKEITQLDAQKDAIDQSAKSELEAKEREIVSLMEAALQGKDESLHEELAKPFEEQLEQFTLELEARTEEEKAAIDLQKKAVEAKAESKIAAIKERYSSAELEKNRLVVVEQHAAKIAKLKEVVEAKSTAVEKFQKTEVLDPVTGGMIDNRSIIDGTFAEAIELDKLKESVIQTGKMVDDLDSHLQKMRESADLLDQWNELQGHIQDIGNVAAQPSSWFSFPEKGAAKEFIEYHLKKEGDSSFTEPPSVFSAGLSLVGQMGVVDSVRLATAQSDFSSLGSRLSSIDHELRGENQITEERKDQLLAERKEVRKEMLKNPLGITAAASEALASILLASEVSVGSQFECQPEGVAERTASVESAKVSEVLDSELAENCFTPKQLEVLQDNLAKLSKDEQLSYIEQLSNALKMNASILEAQTGLRDNIESISTQHTFRMLDLGEGTASHTHEFSGEVEGKSRKERYQTFFRGKAEFPDREKVSAIYSQLNDRVGTFSSLEFLKNRIDVMVEPVVRADKQEDQLSDISVTIAEIKIKLDPLPPEFIPYLEALEVIAVANTDKYRTETVTEKIITPFIEAIGKATTGEEILLHIQSAYEQVAPIIADTDHQHFVAALRDQTLPEDSLYAEDLATGFEKLRDNNPLAYSAVVGEDQVFEQKVIIAKLRKLPLDKLPEAVRKIRREEGSDEELLQAAYREYRKGAFETTLFDGTLAKAIQADVDELTEQISKEEKEIIARLKAVPLDKLPKPLRKIRLRKGNDAELLQAAFKEYRNGSFDTARFKAETLGDDQLSLDALIGKCLIDRTRKNVLKGARFNATSSVENLGNLLVEKARINKLIQGTPEKKASLALEKAALEEKKAGVDDWFPDHLEGVREERQDVCRKILLKVMTGDISDGAVDPAVGNVLKSETNYRLYVDNGSGGTKIDFVPINTIDALVASVQERRDQEKAALDIQIEDKQREIDTYDEKLQSQLDAVNATWKKESASLEDYTDRCQSSKHLTDLPPSLKPYGRHINYLQEKMGLVLRDDQIETLVEIVENPALLKQLRMGLGKTSIIVPFALMILGAKGHNTIGMVPKALFTTNFDEMDDTTRTVFELSGNQFLFSRQDANFPLNVAALHKLSEKCAGFFKALERGEYILTTIESKASLDNKISELERSQAMIQDKIEILKADEDDDHETEIEPLFQDLVNHQMALDMLYRVKDVFEADRTRLIIDEVDSVAKANYSVNSESGVKTPIEQNIQEVAVDIFDAIRKNDKMQAIFAKILENNQFTLDDAEVNAAIKEIGGILIKDYPQIEEEKKEQVLEWFAGERDCPYTRSELRELGPLKNKLMIMRKALNSGLRSSLGLKAGLSCDFDPTHGAIGVPASQGVTSKTTKYSDQLMQVILTQMVALYKPQGETFLQATSLEVIEEMKKELQEIDGVLADLDKEDKARGPLIEKRTELRAGVFKLSKLVNPQGFLKELETDLRDVEAKIAVKSTQELEDKKVSIEQEIAELTEYIAQNDEKSPPVLENEIAGDQPVDVFLRQRFAQQVAKRGMIYVSTSEMSRPVQHALRGCNVIGLTGTATRNTEHVITSTGHAEALDGVTAAGRETTAEVVYRFVKALTKEGESPEQALKTEVQTYSLDSEKAFQNFVRLAKKGSGYRFIVNQAGSCDHMSLREITRGLHEQAGRPIVYLDMDEDGRTEKVALIDGQRKPLSRLSEAEGALIKAEGFFYYHTPHVRGTDFRIPPGSRGALMMSPKVNANDRDQAIYRARSLGEGHIVEPFLSEKQADEFSAMHGGAAITVGDMLKIQHEQTREDEGQEDLSAYTLHIKGMVTYAADQAKKDLQLEGKSAKHVGQWMRTSDRKERFAEIEAKVEAFQILEKMFTKDTGNEAYLRQLESEMRQGGTISTKEYLCDVVIPGERARITRYLKQLDEVDTEDKPELEQAIKKIVTRLEQADKKLEAEATRIEKDWAKLERQLPKETSSAPATQETAETEAEAEAEAVAETTSETEAESTKRKRAKKTKGILMEPDLELLKQLRSDAASVSKPHHLEKITLDQYHETNSQLSSDTYSPSIWKGRDNVVITPRLLHILEKATLGQPPQIKAVVLETHKGPVIILTDAGDANQLTGHFSLLRYDSQKALYDYDSFLTTAYSVTPSTNEDGMIKLKYGGTGTLGQSRSLDFEDDKCKGDIYFSLLLLGHTLISEDGWNDMEAAWKEMDAEAQKNLRDSLEEKLSTVTLQKAALRLWDKPKPKAISLGGAKQEAEKYTNVALAKAAIEKVVSEPWVTRKYQVAKQWIDKHSDDSIKEELLDFIDDY